MRIPYADMTWTPDSVVKCGKCITVYPVCIARCHLCEKRDLVNV